MRKREVATGSDRVGSSCWSVSNQDRPQTGSTRQEN